MDEAEASRRAAWNKAYAGTLSAEPLPEAKAAVNSIAAKLRKTLRKLHLSNSHVEKLDQQVKSLQDATCPKDMKPHKLPFPYAKQQSQEPAKNQSETQEPHQKH